ncbi:MFS transporter [Marinigracilibium pacificum]|uniref:MFS transporter n=1 Tax=Marinigracilibium pacificum TaxID=2729599 RepID=A0A848J5Q9_9BACT|nr:MFS transporter [Marinigracilibium pacificum]NMM48462.1 MFS transporter [Marinigracilibium pacificum]
MSFFSTSSRVYSTWLFGCFIGLGIFIFNISAVIQFLATNGMNDLPEALLYGSVSSIILYYFYNYTKLRVSFWTYTSILIIINLIFYLLLLLNVFDYSQSEIGMIMMSATLPLTGLYAASYFGFTELLFNITDLKKYRPVLYSGVIIPVSAYLFSVPWVIDFIDLGWNLQVIFSGVALFLALISLFVIAVDNINLNELHYSAQYVNAHNSFKNLVKNQYFVRLSLFIGLSTMVFLLIEYSFIDVLNTRFESSSELVAFLSVLTASILVASWLIDFLAVRLTIRAYGLRTGLLVLPVVVLLVGGLTYGAAEMFGVTNESKTFFMFFVLMTALKASSEAIKKGFEHTVFMNYFLPVRSELRFDSRFKSEFIISSFFAILASSGLMILNHHSLLNLKVVLIGVIALVVIWIISGFILHSRYKRVLRSSLDFEQQLIKHDKALSESLLERLSAGLLDKSVEDLPRQLNLIRVLEPIEYRNVLIDLLNLDDDRIREVVLKQCDEMCLLEAIPLLDNIMESKYFPVMKTAALTRSVYSKLRGAEFRLEKLKYIEQLTLSKLVNERVYGAMLTAYAEEAMKGNLLNKLFRDPHDAVRYHAVASSAFSEDKDLNNNLIEKLGETAYGNAAAAALAATGEPVFQMLETAFYLTGQDQKTQLRIVQIYGRVGSREAVKLLLKKLNYPNQNIIAASLEALSHCGYNVDENNSLQIRSELQEVCGAMVWNMSVVNDLRKGDSSDLLISAMENEIAYNLETIFRLLALIYDPKSVELVKRNIHSDNNEEKEYATDLLQVFLNEELKPALLPVLGVASYEEKVEQLKHIYPTEPMSKSDALLNIVQRDYKWINRWTKACGLRELSNDKSVDPDIFAANLVNPDPLLRETAANALATHYEGALDEFYERYGNLKRYKHVADTIRAFQEEKSGDDGLTTRIEIIEYMNTIPVFKNISGLVLAEIAKMVRIEKYPEGTRIETKESINFVDYLLVTKGRVMLKIGDNQIEFRDGDIVNCLDHINAKDQKIELVSFEDTVIFRIDQAAFHEMMSFYDEIPEALSEISLSKMNDTKEEIQVS